MQKIKNFISKFGSAFAMFALFIGVLTANSACLLVVHQPKEPEAMNKFKF